MASDRSRAVITGLRDGCALEVSSETGPIHQYLAVEVLGEAAPTFSPIHSLPRSSEGRAMEEAELGAICEDEAGYIRRLVREGRFSQEQVETVWARAFNGDLNPCYALVAADSDVIGLLVDGVHFQIELIAGRHHIWNRGSL